MIRNFLKTKNDFFHLHIYSLKEDLINMLSDLIHSVQKIRWILPSRRTLRFSKIFTNYSNYSSESINAKDIRKQQHNS